MKITESKLRQIIRNVITESMFVGHPYYGRALEIVNLVLSQVEEGSISGDKDAVSAKVKSVARNYGMGDHKDWMVDKVMQKIPGIGYEKWEDIFKPAMDELTELAKGTSYWAPKSSGADLVKAEEVSLEHVKSMGASPEDAPDLVDIWMKRMYGKEYKAKM